MTYPQACTIARDLSTLDTNAAHMLREMCEQTKRSVTFIIMRYGDPRSWRRIPQVRDARTLRTGRTGLRVGTRAWTKKMGRVTVLEHAETGRVVKAPTILAFCEKAGLVGCSGVHITPILNGDRPSYKGWYRPDFLDQAFNLKDVYGNEVNTTVRDYIRKVGRKGAGQANRLLTGRKRTMMDCQVMLADTPVKQFIQPRSVKITNVELTDGKRVFRGANLSEVARQAGVNSSNLYHLAYGFREQAYGLRVKSITTEKRQALSVLTSI